jgi:hypothetical protein
MGAEDYTLKEVVQDLNTTVKDLTKSVNSFQILVAEEYVKKTACEGCQAIVKTNNDANNAAHSTIYNCIVGAYGFILTVGGLIVGYLQLRSK